MSIRVDHKCNFPFCKKEAIWHGIGEDIHLCEDHKVALTELQAVGKTTKEADGQ